MKKLILALSLIIMGCTISFAQSAKDIRKERAEIRKLTRAEMNEKASKDAKKEAKILEKKGWEVTPGALPLVKQLDRSYMMQYELNDDLSYKYIWSDAQSIGGNYDAAKMQALELAKKNLASQIQTEVTSLIENTVANEQLDAEQAASITRSVQASKNLISQSIGRVIPVVEAYRTLSNKNKEVLVRIVCNSDMAKKAALNAVKQDLQQKGDELHNKLDQLLGW